MDSLSAQIATASNAPNIGSALDILARLIRTRCRSEKIAPEGSIQLPYFDDGSALGTFIRDRLPPFDEYVVILLALAPHVRPTLLDSESRTFLPTGETAAFLLAGDDFEARFEVQRLFAPDHWFAREGIIRLEAAAEGAPILSGRLVMARDWVERFTLGSLQAPAFGAAFPARRIETTLSWDDLILPESAREQIGELEDWVRHHRQLAQDWGMGGRIRPGYRALFHGPPGTGKTMTATLLGNSTGRDVYRIDLSTIVSKYIGETEKNLAALFDRAANREWILFFDEADALFGKRTGVKDAHDRYANQEVSYLLQRVEDFDGLVILSSNFRANIDEAFLRRFNAIIRFPLPTREEREEIWLRTLPDRGDRAGLARRLSDFELSGGNIVNIVQFAAISAIAADREEIGFEDTLKGVQREVEKEGKVFAGLPAA